MSVAGTDFGNAVHAIFEHREPMCGLPEQKVLIRRCLVENNVQYRDGDAELEEYNRMLAARSTRP